MVQQARMLVSQREYDTAVPLLKRAQTLAPKSYIAQYLNKVSSAATAAAN
ncbi:MAG: hypothetical protein J6386_05765 [Candidatus Synoicihabitans palmerolidicus]|nr:hypothetical protein [Candidatus Synoicihabitans palmerolidicus]